MACKYTYKGITYNSKEEFISQIINPQFLSNQKIRRVMEVQSDLFQKGRLKEDLILSQNEDNVYNAKKEDSTREEFWIAKEKGKQVSLYNNTFYEYNGYYYDFLSFSDKYYKIEKNSKIDTSENQFLQLLNKDNNWVTFFVKSIIQDSAKKGYEKVLFPSGDTASKVEGHTTLEEFKKQKEDRVKELEKQENDNKDKIGTKRKTSLGEYIYSEENYKEDKENINNEINQLKQELERVETEGFAALRPIYNFYENTVANILKKQGYNPIEITDEYGNKWNEVTLNQARDLANILLQRNEANQIIGQANIKAMTVLIDAVNQRSDTIPHEYAHHYIAWFRNTPIVQEAIEKWGSEEALVQSIGEQVVKQKGEAYNWWNKFVKWIMNQFNSLSKLQKEELTQILTDAFLTRQDLGSKADIQGFKDFVQGKQFQKLTAEEKAKTIERITREQNNSLFGLNTSKVVPINPNLVDNSEIQYSKRESNSNTIDRLATSYSQMFEDENTDLDNALKEKKLLEYLNKQIKYIDEEGNECAKFGLKTGVSGTNWRIEENLNWGKKHSEGGIDLTMTDDGIVFRRNNSDIKASHGLVIKAEDGLVMQDESNIDGEDPKKPPKYPKSIKIKDGRVKNPITGKPFNGNKSGDYDYLLMHEVVHNAKKYGIDPYNFLAMAMQETTLGKAGGGMSNPFHILNSSTIESKMDKKRYSEYFKNKTDRMRPVEMAANFYKNVKLLDKPKKKNPNIQDDVWDLQSWNGYGSIYHTTEQHIDGGGDRYGVSIPKEGINMSKNPMYGIWVKDLSNIFRDSKEVNDLVTRIYGPNAPAPYPDRIINDDVSE